MSVPRLIVLTRSRDSGWLTTAGRRAPANTTAPTARAAARLSMLTSSSPARGGPAVDHRRAPHRRDGGHHRVVVRVVHTMNPSTAAW